MADEQALERAEANGRHALPEADERVAAPGVVLLVDYPVLLRAMRATDPNAVPELTGLVRRAASFGPILSARGYGAWYDVDEALTAFTAGLDPVFVPPAGPGSVPTTTALVADGLTL